MAKSKSKNKERVIEALILVFVVVSISLLAVQIGMNVSDTLQQERSTGQQINSTTPSATMTPIGPTPTIDFSVPVQE